MSPNLGMIDRALRFVLGIALMAVPMLTSLSLWESAIAKYAVMVIGAILIITSILRFCPLYRFFGVRTCEPG